jgi:nitrate reductase NapE component
VWKYTPAWKYTPEVDSRKPSRRKSYFVEFLIIAMIIVPVLAILYSYAIALSFILLSRSTHMVLDLYVIEKVLPAVSTGGGILTCCVIWRIWRRSFDDTV